MLYYVCYAISHRWQNDSKCTSAYPQDFDNIEKTLRNYRKTKYGKSPTTAEEIQMEFEKPEVFEDLGRSKFREHGILFNEIDIQENFTNCTFSSAKSIQLVKDNLEPQERFFIMDGTFRIAPHGIFQQVLIIHVVYVLKVSMLQKFFVR